MKNGICYGQTIGRGFVQEWYETSARTAAVRARELRKAGFAVCVSSMGWQVTNVGKVKMTLVTANFDPYLEMPELPSVVVVRI